MIKMLLTSLIDNGIICSYHLAIIKKINKYVK